MDLNAGFPYWLIKYGLPFDYPMLNEDVKADVVIMGGGISGALTAYYLMKAGVDCLLIDARTIGLGSTCVSTSLLQYEIDVPLCELQKKIGTENAVKAYRLCEEAIDSLQAIANKIGFKDIQEKESLYYAASGRDDKFIKEEYETRKQHGFDVSLLDKTAIREQFNIKSTSAILSQKGAQTNAYNFTHALHQYNISKGMRVFDRTEAVKIRHSKEAVELVTNKGFVIKAKKLLYATGYEVVKYIDKKIVNLQSTYAICTEQLLLGEMPVNTNALLWNTADPYLYMRTTMDNRLIIGGRDEAFYNPKKRDRLLPKKQKQLESDLKKLFSALNVKTEFGWTGTFGSTKDGLPYIGEYKKLPNSLFALGFGGNGITFSLIAAVFLTDLIRGIKNPDIDLFAFDR